MAFFIIQPGSNETLRKPAKSSPSGPVTCCSAVQTSSCTPDHARASRADVHARATSSVGKSDIASWSGHCPTRESQIRKIAKLDKAREEHLT
eukprot:11589963-Heterocapsa_arctica.AAC.1